MDELGPTAITALLAQMRAEAHEFRRAEREAAEKAARAEAVIEAIEARFDIERAMPEHMATREEREAMQRRGDALRGQAAVAQVMASKPGHIWRPVEVHRELEDRGWVSPKARHPRAATEAAIGRLVRSGTVEKLTTGRYRWAGQRSANGGQPKD